LYDAWSDHRLRAGGASDERCYSSPDGNFFGVDPGGVVRAVRTTSPEIFTDRFVRPVFSKMEEVVSRYGVPEKVERLASGVSFVYGPLSFQVDAAGTAQDIMPKPVAAITLRLAEAAVPIVRRRLSDPNPMKLPADFCQNVAQLVDSAWEGFDSIRVDPGQRVSADGRKWNVTLDLTGRGNSSLQYETRDLYAVRGANEWDWTSNVPKFVATFDAAGTASGRSGGWLPMTEQYVPPGSVWKDYRDPSVGNGKTSPQGQTSSSSSPWIPRRNVVHDSGRVIATVTALSIEGSSPSNACRASRLRRDRHQSITDLRPPIRHVTFPHVLRQHPPGVS
jgi:hypothetical protein